VLLYFIENVASCGKSQLSDVALEHAFPEGVEMAVRQSGAGPAGSSGVVLSSDAGRCGYFPDDQEWREISPAFGRRRWVGWWKDTPPTPAGLQRSTVLDGKAVKLADGQEWIIPRAYEIDEGRARPCLPAVMRRLPSGGWTRGDVLPRYRGLWEIAERLQATVAQSYLFDDVANVIGANYRVAPDEVGALGLLDTASTAALGVIGTLLDFDGYEQLQKKTTTHDS
jgi:hypothetical protein